MEASDELLMIATLAIGLAVSAGVVVSSTHRGGLHPTDRFRFIALFSQALFVVVLAFVPFGFHHAGQDAPVLWMASSGVMLVFWVYSAWWLGVRLRPEFSAEEDLPKQLFVVLYGLLIFNLLLQVANFVGWPMESGALPYLAGLLIWLSVAALLFVTLVLYRAKE